jgi:hypothetical protein
MPNFEIEDGGEWLPPKRKYFCDKHKYGVNFCKFCDSEIVQPKNEWVPQKLIEEPLPFDFLMKRYGSQGPLTEVSSPIGCKHVWSRFERYNHGVTSVCAKCAIRAVDAVVWGNIQ